VETKTKAPRVNKKKDRPLTDLELEIARNCITFHDEIFDEEDAKKFHDLSRKRYEDTIRYEQENKRRRRG